MRGELRQKTKTKFVEAAVSDVEYKRRLNPFLAKHQSLKYAKLLIMSRYGMLDCANNFAITYGGKMCNLCKVIDDENHRLNQCEIWKHVNLYNEQNKAEFNDIYSTDLNKCLEIVRLLRLCGI